MKIWINADDYGWNESCSKAIIQAFSQGFITTATACVNGEFFEEAIDAVKGTMFENKIGVHINLTEGKPLTKGILCNPLFCKDEKFIMFPHRYRILSADDKKNVYDEITAQIKKFKATGVTINHVDSHHHIHNAMNIFPIFMEVMREHGIMKIRKYRNVGNISAAKKIMKRLYNYRLERQGYTYSELFGSVCDYQNFMLDKNEGTVFEMMTHPDYNCSGDIVDRDPSASYNDPYGAPMAEIINDIINKEDVIIK